MPKKKQFDNAKLIKMIEEGIPSPEIRKKLNIKTANQLKVAYAIAMMESGKVPKIIDGRKSTASSDSNVVTVGKRGSVIIPKDMAVSLGIAVGDKFLVRKSKAGIALKKL
jgi:AbrB family looped-hinge helix DNA binding protein